MPSHSINYFVSFYVNLRSPVSLIYFFYRIVNCEVENKEKSTFPFPPGKYRIGIFENQEKSDVIKMEEALQTMPPFDVADRKTPRNVETFLNDHGLSDFLNDGFLKVYKHVESFHSYPGKIQWWDNEAFAEDGCIG